MISNQQYIRLSLELNVFFLRITKEHLIFAAASLPLRDASVSRQLVTMKRNFEMLLSRAVSLSRGNISREVASSGELVTSFTLPAEKATQFLTGIPIDTSITTREINLGYREAGTPASSLLNSVNRLNQDAMVMVNQAIAFQTNLLKNILACRAFSYVYPSNLHHVTEEARTYVSILRRLQNRQGEDTTVRGLIEQEIFWNHIMEEHSKFIRGYLDPSETELFNRANRFSEQFERLEEQTEALVKQPNNFGEVTRESIRLVTELRNFKRQGTQGLLACKIKAIMSALLADHVTREANHYLRLLRNYKS